MRILHVTLSYSPGGRREAVRTLAAGLRETGVRSHLACLDEFGSDAAVRSECFDDGIELRRRRLFDWRAIRRLRRYCREHAIDLVHTHDAASQFTAALALPGLRIPLIMTFHRTLGFESAGRIDRIRNAIACLRSAAVVTASSERREHYILNNRVSAGKVVCIPLGIDAARFRPDPRRRDEQRARLGVGTDMLLVGAAGHFNEVKGIDLAIRAFQRCLELHPHLQTLLVVLGGGDAQRELLMRSLIAPAFEARVQLAGFQPHPEQWFPAFDVFLHGARMEAFGLVLVEAMACGVPVVAPRVGGIPDVVSHGETGLLVDRPDVEELAAALASLLGSKERRATLGAAGPPSVRMKHTRQGYAAAHLALYERLLARSAPA